MTAILDPVLDPADSDPVSQRRRYDALKAAGDRAKEAGLLEAALAAYGDAWQVARELADDQLADRALCNRSFPAIELGEWDAPVRDLRNLLLRSVDSEVRLMASYHLARAYELRKEYRKALFYARAAQQHSRDVRQELWVAACHNQMGNLLLAESQPAAAWTAYNEAWDAMPEGNEVWRARVLDNLGYCRVLQGRLAEGLALLYQSLRSLRQLGARRFEISTRLDLCFAHLEAERADRAARHGEVALALAEEFGDTESLKNALYLLGEASNLSGAEGRARQLFERLQREFYPGEAFIPDFLLAVDVRKMVNLRA